MTIEVQPTVTIPRGDAKVLPFTVTEGDTGDVYSLSNADIEWELHDRRNEDVELSLDDTGVSIQNRDDLNGEFKVKLDTGTTEDIETGLYREYIRITDDSGNRTTFIGRVQLVKST